MLDHGGGASEEAVRLGDKARRCPSPLGLFSPASSPCAAVIVPTHAFQPGPPAGLGSFSPTRTGPCTAGVGGARSSCVRASGPSPSGTEASCCPGDRRGDAAQAVGALLSLQVESGAAQGLWKGRSRFPPSVLG